MGGRVHLPLAIMNNTEQWRGHSVVWQIWPGGPSAFGIYMFIYALVFPYICLLVDCFKWSLIGHIEQQRVCSVLWQFRTGGYMVSFTWVKTDFSLYFPISWLFWMGSHWSHWTVKSSISALAVSNGREGGRSIISFTRVNLKIWAHLLFYALLHRRTFRITYERPNNHYLSHI